MSAGQNGRLCLEEVPMSHDQRYKDLLRAFFHDFLTLFLPAIVAGVDPGAITFVDTQTFTSQPEGNLRQADLVARLIPLSGQPKRVLLHRDIFVSERGGTGRFSRTLYEREGTSVWKR